MIADSTPAAPPSLEAEAAEPKPDLSPFHLAIPVNDLAASRKFYGELLGCREGRSDTRWVDFDFFGHQLVCHLADEGQGGNQGSNPVDGHAVPVPHFGIVLGMDQWIALADQLKQHNLDFVIAPCIRFAGQPGEQGTLFLRDPSGNALEFKGFRDRSSLFAK